MGPLTWRGALKDFNFGITAQALTHSGNTEEAFSLLLQQGFWLGLPGFVYWWIKSPQQCHCGRYGIRALDTSGDTFLSVVPPPRPGIVITFSAPFFYPNIVIESVATLSIIMINAIMLYRK